MSDHERFLRYGILLVDVGGAQLRKLIQRQYHAYHCHGSIDFDIDMKNIPVMDVQLFRL